MIDQPNSFMSHLWDSDKVRRARFRPRRASAPDAARRPKSCRRLARAVILRGGDPRLARQRLDSAGKPPIMLRCVATMMRPALRPAGLNRASLPSSARPPSSAAGAWTTARLSKEPSLCRSSICGAIHNVTPLLLFLRGRARNAVCARAASIDVQCFGPCIRFCGLFEGFFPIIRQKFLQRGASAKRGVGTCYDAAIAS
jgi:hypothetical protein